MRARLSVLSVFFLLNLSLFQACQSRHLGEVQSASRVGAIGSIDQLIVWETQANLQQFREENAKVEIPSVGIDTEKLEVEWLGSPPQALKDFVALSSEKTRWAKHPFNADKSVPFFEVPHDPALTFIGFLSASRSIFFRTKEDNLAYSIKMPTDHPHKATHQPTKAHMGKESKLTVPFSNHIEAVDAAHGKNSQVWILSDVAMVIEKETLNGYTIRKLSPIDSQEFYYFPAFGIDSLGKEVMLSCKKSEAAQTAKTEELSDVDQSEQAVKEFWTKHYAQASGVAKANVLMLYGVLQSTPNSQNWLIELDKASMCPTGKVVIRDIVDAKPVVPLALNIGFEKFVNEWTQKGGVPAALVDLNTGTTLWTTMLEYDQNANRAHETAFLATLSKIYSEEVATMRDVQRLISDQGKTVAARNSWLSKP